jgi:hypothetical protein
VGEQVYHLNHMDSCAGEHYTYGYEYETPTISLPGGATVYLFVRNPQEPDDLINTNHMMSRVEYPPGHLQVKLNAIHAHPPEGQYVYLEVKSVKVR